MRPRRMSAEQEQELREYVIAHSPTLDEVLEHLEEQGLSYSVAGARKVLVERLGAYLPHGRARGSAQRWWLPGHEPAWARR
jgi:transposase